MNLSDCPREMEVVDAVTSGRWPDGCDEELRAHAASCPVCDDLVSVAGAFAADMQDALHGADVPPSGAVWWRMQRRARAETVRTAARAITFVQAASVAGAIAVALTILGGVTVMSETFRTWLARVADVLYFGGITLPTWTFPLLLAFAVTLALAPLALWLAVRED